MRIGAAFPSKYLKAADLPEGKMVNVQIDHVTVENVAGNDNPDDEKPVLYFVGQTKGMVLNKTNAGTISAAYGDETEDWQGKPILLFTTEVPFQGKMVPSIRVKADRSRQPAQQQNGGGRIPAAREPGPFDNAVAPEGGVGEKIPF